MSMIHLSNLCSQLQNASRCRLGLTSLPRNNLTLSIMLLLQREGFISALQHGSVYGPEPVDQSVMTGQIQSVEQFDQEADRDPVFHSMLGAPPINDGAEAQSDQLSSTASKSVGRLEYWMDRARKWNPDPPNRSKSPQERGSSLLAFIAPASFEPIEEKRSTGPIFRTSSPYIQSDTSVLSTFASPTMAEKLNQDSRLPRDMSAEKTHPSLSDASGAITQATVAHTRLWATMKYHRNMPVLSKMNVVSKPTRRIHMRVNQMAQLIRGHTASLIKGLQPGECLIVGTDKGIMEIREAVRRRLGGQLLCRVL